MEHQTVSLPRVMVAAPASSSGKTSLTCALLQAALNRGVDPCAFKCGPDYIDPLFHRAVLSLPSRQPSAPSRLSHASAVLASLPSK